MYEVQRGDAEVKCPYYKRYEKGRITCEGFFEGGNTVLEFQAKTRRATYMREHCSSIEGCKECQLHKLLDEKWGVSDAK